MNQAPQSPLGMRIGNVVLGLLNRVGIGKQELTPHSLIAAAKERTQLSHFPAEYSEEALTVLCESLNTEADLTPLGRLLTRQLLLSGLETQLKLEDWFLRNPEIAQERIEKPIIIIGMPRTGTTILHELMQLDPNNRIPVTWEVAHPFPPPETASFSSDPRIELEAKRLKVSHYLMPGLENLHRMGAELPQECVAITGYVFASMLYTTVYRLPTYAHWLANHADMSSVYRFHRRMHQLLQWRCPGKRWVIKSPGHLWCLEAVLREYPDALLVQTHRDPLKIVSSLGSMLPVMRSAYQRDIDTQEIAVEWAENNGYALNASRESRETGAIPAEQIIDIQFAEFMASPENAVRSIYQKFGLEFSPQTEAAIRQYIAENPADKHGGHKHHFNDTGLNYTAERARVRAYQEYFGVASEF